MTTDGFAGAIFDVDGVLVDSPHERAWQDSLRELMENDWSDIRDRTTWSPEAFTSQVYQEVMSGKPRTSGALAALEYFEVPDAEDRVETYATRHGRNVEQCSPEAMRLLQRYRWPGNVRELEHAIERAVIVATGTLLTPADLPSVVHEAHGTAPSATFSIPPHHTLEEIERLAIIQTLERTRGNKRAAASILGVYRPTLYSKLRKYKIAGRPERAEGIRAQRRSRN